MVPVWLVYLRVSQAFHSHLARFLFLSSLGSSVAFGWSGRGHECYVRVFQGKPGNPSLFSVPHPQQTKDWTLPARLAFPGEASSSLSPRRLVGGPYRHLPAYLLTYQYLMYIIHVLLPTVHE
ncbi:hypothetical protein LX32DRAFT_145735 [Colletotrichum zoysiae]|uniref:Uncharacterized protein n=1 Tax=Colletotrichum zoysiae TaxID=1216348 RepID=A0AAD9H6K5_9PEZI|nr:hypothetical protein LX32DRAFT_145735 [Colletotrichum zoysiae]